MKTKNIGVGDSELRRIDLTRRRDFSQACPMKPTIFISAVMIAVAVSILAGLHAVADSQTNNFRADLDGYHETPLSISTNGTGSFQAMLNPTGNELTYELQYSGLEGEMYYSRTFISDRSGP